MPDHDSDDWDGEVKESNFILVGPIDSKQRSTIGKACGSRPIAIASSYSSSLVLYVYSGTSLIRTP